MPYVDGKELFSVMWTSGIEFGKLLNTWFITVLLNSVFGGEGNMEKYWRTIRVTSTTATTRSRV